jgi:hypothetical protein
MSGGLKQPRSLCSCSKTNRALIMKAAVYTRLPSPDTATRGLIAVGIREGAEYGARAQVEPEQLGPQPLEPAAPPTAAPDVLAEQQLRVDDR